MLTTRRLVLRPFAPKDIPAYAAIRAEPDVARYLPGGVGNVANAYDIAERLVSAFARLWSEADGPGYGPWAVELRDTGELIGHLGLRRLDELGGETELLYALRPVSQGNGYAAEGAKAALEFGFETLRLKKIIAMAAPENAASLRVMEKIGMTQRRGLTKAFGMRVIRADIANP